MPKDVFDFAEHEEKTTYGLGSELTITKNVDNSVLNRANATIVGKINANSIEWYVPHYTPSIPHQAILLKQNHLTYLQSFIMWRNLFS